MIRTTSYRPEVGELETRFQPGSVLTGMIDASLFADSLSLLGQSLLAPASQSRQADQTTAAVEGTSSAVNATGLGLPNRSVVEFSVLESQSPLTTVPPALDRDLVDTVMSGKDLAAIPISQGGGGSRIFGGACEEAGNVVVNGDFEAGGAPWFQFGDDYAGIAAGGHLTTGAHLVMGAYGQFGVVGQELFTEPGVPYTIRFSIRVDAGQPSALYLAWNDTLLADFTGLPPSQQYIRVEGVAAVVGSGYDIFWFIERHDPNYWHVDDVCVTPYVG